AKVPLIPPFKAIANIKGFFYLYLIFSKKILCSFVLKEKQKMIIAIDVGNTRIKVAVYDRNTWGGFYHIATKDFRSQIENITEKLPEKPFIIVSSVGKLNEYQLKWLGTKGFLHIVSANDKLPFENKYATPQTLGA